MIALDMIACIHRAHTDSHVPGGLRVTQPTAHWTRFTGHGILGMKFTTKYEKKKRETDSERKTWLCRSPTSFQAFLSVVCVREREAAAAASETAEVASPPGYVPSP